MSDPCKCTNQSEESAEELGTPVKKACLNNSLVKSNHASPHASTNDHDKKQVETFYQLLNARLERLAQQQAASGGSSGSSNPNCKPNFHCDLRLWLFPLSLSAKPGRAFKLFSKFRLSKANQSDTNKKWLSLAEIVCVFISTRAHLWKPKIDAFENKCFTNCVISIEDVSSGQDIVTIINPNMAMKSESSRGRCSRRYIILLHLKPLSLSLSHFLFSSTDSVLSIFIILVLGFEGEGRRENKTFWPGQVVAIVSAVDTSTTASVTIHTHTHARATVSC